MNLIVIIILVVLFFKIVPPILEKRSKEQLAKVQAELERERAIDAQLAQQQAQQAEARKEAEMQEWAHKTLIKSNIDFMTTAYNGLCDAAKAKGCILDNKVKQEYFMLSLFYMDELNVDGSVDFREILEELFGMLENEEWQYILNGLTMPEFAQAYVASRKRCYDMQNNGGDWFAIANSELQRINTSLLTLNSDDASALINAQVDIVVNQYAIKVDRLNKM